MKATSIFQTAAVSDDDALFTGIVTGAAVTKTEADVTGVLGAQFAAGSLPAHTLSITTSAGVGNWSTTLPIVITGKYNNKVVTESLQPTVANGGQALVGTQPFDPGSISVAVPLEPGAGTLKVGVVDMCSSERRQICGVRAITAANVAVRCAGHDAVLAMAAKEIEEVAIDRILGATTTAQVRVLFGTP